MYLCGNLIIMKKILIFSFLLLPLVAKADLLSYLLQGEYNPKTLSANEIDSVLNPIHTARYRLEYENRKQLFRHSFEADYYIVDTRKNTRKPISNSPVRDAQLSPDGRYVVYAKANNLYIYKVEFDTEVAITNNEDKDIINGISDWLYEEEFGITRMFEFSPDSKQVAFVQLDERSVATFQWQDYLPQEKGDLYPYLYALRYPKAGSNNPKASVCVYDTYYKSIKTMQIGDTDDGYVPRIAWTNTTMSAQSEVIVQKLNRDQNHMEVYVANPKSTISRLLYSEKYKDYYVDFELFDQWQWLSDNRFLVVTEQRGWRSVWLYSEQGLPIRQLTKNGMDVTRVYGFDERQQVLYFQAAPTPQTRQAYALNIRKNSLQQLTKGEGIHNLSFSADWTLYVDDYQSCETPNIYSLHNTATGRQLKVLLDNADLQKRWQELQLPEMRFFSFVTERGDTLNGWYLKPNGKDKYPVVMTQYSGPASQRVLNMWRKRWDYYLASQGFVVICVDPRGTDARGREWRAQTYMHLGTKEAEDQLSAAQYAQTLPFVDADKIGMIGWSYGGFQVINTMSRQKTVSATELLIKCGVAIAPVIDWRLYDSAYTERYMRRPQVNESGYEESNLNNLATDLQGKLLLVHGMADDNVHVQHSMQYIDALVRAGKQFEMQIYPDDNHFLRQRNNYLHLHERLMIFLNQNLK